MNIISDVQDFENTMIQKFYEKNPKFKIYRIERLKFALNPTQRKDLLTVATRQNRRHYRIIKVLMEAGIRVGEIVNLTIPQANLVSGEIRIEAREKTRWEEAWQPKTKSGNRRIPIHEGLADLLAEDVGKRNRGYIFESQKGGHYEKSSIIRFVNRYAKLAPSIGHTIGAHALRRTYASQLLNQGASIGDISKLLGHSSIRTTMIYLFKIDAVDYDKIREITRNMNEV